MDEGANRLGSGEPGTRTAILEAEAAALRDRLDTLLDELDRRRRRAKVGGARLRRFAVPALVGAGVLVGGAAALVAWRRRRARSWLALALRAR